MIYTARFGSFRKLSLVFMGCMICLLPGCARDAERGDALQSVSFQDGVHLGPLAKPATKPSPGSLFEQLIPAECGIDFVHQWKPADRYEASLLKTGFTGGGVAVGDYDGDGRNDVLFTSPHSGARLYKNLGDFRFEDVTQRVGVSCLGAWTTGAAFVDVNQDGKLDIVVCAYDRENFVFLNQGDGRFTDRALEMGLGFRGASVKLIFADYDRDGDLDAMLVTNRLEPRKEMKVRYLGEPGAYTVAPESQELVGIINLPSGEQKFTKAGQADRLFRNELKETGKLQFREVSQEAGVAGFYHGLDATWWDYNRDGYPDLYIANDFTDPDQFYRNNGDGTFTEITQAALPCLPWFAMGAAFGDINRDQRFDLIATDMAGTTHYRQKMAMGSMDAVAWFLDTAEPRQFMRNAFFLNSGTDRFLEVAQMIGLASSDWTWSVKLADLDNDGWEDVYTTNGFTRDYLNSDFNLQMQKQKDNSDALAWYEAPELKEANLAFRNDHHLHFTNVAQDWGLADVGISFGAAMGDLDQDGDLDLVVNNFDGPPSIYRNHSDQHRTMIRLRGTKSNSFGIGTTVSLTTDDGTQIRYLNPFNGYLSSNDPAVYFGLGKAQQIESLTIEWPSGVRQQLGPLAVNQLLTITEPSASTGGETGDAPETKPLFQTGDRLVQAKHQERFFDDFLAQPLLPNKLSQLGPCIAAADVDQDGDVDLFLGGAAGQPGTLLLNRGDGSFGEPSIAPFEDAAASEDMGAVWFDADDDGDLDLYVVSGGVEAEAGSELLRDRLYLNQGVDEQGHLQLVRSNDSLPDLRYSGSGIAVADIDRDGDLDLAVGTRVLPGQYPRSEPSVMLRNDGGRFLDATSTMAPAFSHAGMVTSLLWTDLQGDGWMDLIVTCEYGPIRTFVNESGELRETTEEAGLASLRGWWNSVVAADVDQDGDLDYAVANFGRNTKYHPSNEHPQYIFYGDFEGTGQTHIVEAKSTGESLLPVRGRSCSSNAMPFLKDRFETYHSFASATLEEIYSEQRLNEALRLDVTTVDSVLLRNDGKGRFVAEPLPDLAQMAPSFGMQFLHANDDPYIDLFLAQNFHAPQRETGRMNGGVGALLLGTPDGKFREVWPSDSGIIIPDDATAACAMDLNGDQWQDLLVAVNDGAPYRILRESVGSTAPLVVELRGPPTNLLAAGSRVRVTYQSGQVTTQEVHQGGGYLSQQPPILYFGRSSQDAPVQLEVIWSDGSRTQANCVGQTRMKLHFGSQAPVHTASVQGHDH
jgi:hypothetical protein